MQDLLEEVAEQVAVAKAPVAVLREGRMVRHRVRQIQPAEPAVGQVQVDLVAEPTLRADAEAIADDQHPDHQLRVDRRSAGRAVVRRQQPPDVGKVDEAVDPPQQMVFRHVILDREAVEERTLRHLLRPHHPPDPPLSPQD
jgi:hypothetical protein